MQAHLREHQGWPGDGVRRSHGQGPLCGFPREELVRQHELG